MACCASCGQPRQSGSSCSCGVPDARDLTRSLVANLVGCVDAARSVAECLGTRPYQVMLVWTRWSGGERGDGVEEVAREEQISPTPVIDGSGGLQRTMSNFGVDETGQISLSEISGRYSEDYLLGLDKDGNAVPQDQNFYWEVRYPTPQGSLRRRYTVQTTPYFDALNVQWKVSLTKASENRFRDGATPL